MKTLSFMPHGHCIYWDQSLLGFHISSDILIAMSYFSIPLAIVYYIRRRSLEARLVPCLFTIFILSCGVTHLFNIWNWWHADYWASGIAKAVCALTSVVTAILLWFIMPKALKIPTAQELAKANERLKRVNDTLETTVAERTASLDQKNQELKKVTDLKTHFFTSVSHEMRNQLNILRGMSEILNRDHAYPPECQAVVTSILKSSNSLARILNDTLDHSKMEQGSIDIKMTSFSMKKLIHSLYEAFQVPAHEKGLELIVDIDTSSFDSVISDELRVSQIISNLITNAIKYTEHGKISLSCKTRLTESGSTEVEILVQDTGSGIPAEDEKRIFESFARSSRHKNIEGLGIGLSLSRYLARILGGDIQLLESSAKGSTFSFKFPSNSSISKKSETPEKKHLNPNWENKRILVVDDAPENLTLIQLFLKPTRIKMDLASSGLKALEYLEKGVQYDLVLLDIEMLDLNGFQTLKKIKSSHPHQPIIAVSAHSDVDYRKKLLEEGFDGHLAKPLTDHDLIQTMTPWMNHES